MPSRAWITDGHFPLLIGLQMTMGRREVWIPRWLERRSVRVHLVQQGLKRIYKVLHWLAKHAYAQRFGEEKGTLTLKMAGIFAMIAGVAVLLPAPMTNNLLGVSIILLAAGVVSSSKRLFAVGLASVTIACVVTFGFVATVLWAGVQALFA